MYKIKNPKKKKTDSEITPSKISISVGLALLHDSDEYNSVDGSVLLVGVNGLGAYDLDLGGLTRAGFEGVRGNDAIKGFFLLVCACKTDGFTI